VAEILTFPGRDTGDKRISADLRLQCLLQAQMNEERAELCPKELGALRKFFEINAQILREVAK
jgi:hypothetical protein